MGISVYMPTRNRSRLAAAAIKSVLSQSFPDFELIVVDDCSTDGTHEMLRSLAAADNRLRVHRNERPLGAPACRNIAIRNASKGAVTGLDDDDEFAPGRLQSLLDFWNNVVIPQGLPTSCLYTQDIYTKCGKRGEITQKMKVVCFEDLLHANHIGNQIFAPREVFEHVGLFDESLPAWQDLEFFMRVTKRFGPARLVDAPLYLRDMTPGLDRISAKFDRVRAAYEAVAQKHFAQDGRAKQRLMLQLFSSYYGVKPKADDLISFMREGVWLKGTAKLASRMF
ncbi:MULTISPECIES: glycosyltransferase family 2 protein [unclassified Bradyrhizobium]